MSLPMILAQVDNGAEIVAGGIGILLVTILVSIVILALVIWAIIDAIKNPNLSDTARIIWIVVIFFLPCLGSVLYLLIGRNATPPGPRTET